MKTYVQSGKTVEKNWVLLDADGITLGKIASKAASLLRGKHKVNFSSHLDDGDYVVIVNAEKIHLSGNKLEQKMLYKHTNHMGGLKAIPYKELMEKKPTAALEKAIKGMLPKNLLGRDQFKNLKVYAGPQHKHQAQNPTKIEIK